MSLKKTHSAPLEICGDAAHPLDWEKPRRQQFCVNLPMSGIVDPQTDSLCMNTDGDGVKTR